MAIHTGKLNGIALCSGNGGIELGLKLALGDFYQAVCYVEREAGNARTLVARMDDETLDRAPVWDDLTTFDGKPWRGIVDIISAGFPCQPHSSAGKQKGVDDERWLWDSIARIISEILPGIVWLENVPNLAFSGLDRVIGSLSEAGYNSFWDTFSAEETGASQKRERLFIFSYADSVFDRSGSLSELVYTIGNGRKARKIGESLRESESSSPAMADDFSHRETDRQIGSSRRPPIIQTSDFIFPPFRNDEEGWRKYLGKRPDLKPAVLRSSDGIANRMDRTRSIGNGVVPLVAAYAFITLARTALNLNRLMLDAR